MNYLTEIKHFYDWLETHSLSANGIVLWHGVMQIASRSGWLNPIEIPSSLLETRTHLERSTIKRVRWQLVEQGLIRLHHRGGRSHCAYTIIPFSDSIAAHFTVQSAPQGVPQKEDTPLITDKTKLNIKKAQREKSSAKKEKAESAFFSPVQWVDTLEEPWRGVMCQWLDYKAARKETYKTELGAKKCLTMLRNLSGGNADIAQQIIDQSMANNWAGLFALRDRWLKEHPPDGRQYGQRIGQILQTEDENKRQRCIDRLKNAGKR
ncbi:MAG: hypothetical protein J1E33_06865 [Alistipes sp.]|nr:hypothetical protein [Alistipes sp.]